MLWSDHYVFGKWIAGQGAPFISIDPGNNTEIWSGVAATTEQINLAVYSARQAFPCWMELSIESRCSYLDKFTRIIKSNKESLVKTISIENGKPLWESYLEVNNMINKFVVSKQIKLVIISYYNYLDEPHNEYQNILQHRCNDSLVKIPKQLHHVHNEY